MLSIGKLGLGQQRYYERQVAQGQDDYYSGRGEAPGYWTGSGAYDLGLEGVVGASEFGALLSGLDPNDTGVRLRSSERDPKIAALDLTFSAPKSFSVLVAVSTGEVMGELLRAHDEAVNGALHYLEDEALMVRRGAGGQRVEKAEGLIAVAYRHRMSRSLDPQIHTHVVVANLAKGPDARYTALHGQALYAHAKSAGYLYQAHLRALVRERLGLEWGPVHNGAAELAAIPKEILAEFSRRRAQMLDAAERGGISLSSKQGRREGGARNARAQGLQHR